jgi:sugar phosphate isomerase/epimerase
MLFTRRDVVGALLATVPALRVLDAGSTRSIFAGVQIGAITYSFGSMKLDEVIQAYEVIGLDEMELMSETAEAAAGAPPVNTPSHAQALLQWRKSVSMDKFAEIRNQAHRAGIRIGIFCFNMNESITADEMDYAFTAAKALGAQAISTSTRVTVAKRIAPLAEKHKMRIGFHGHDNNTDPNEVGSLESYQQVLSYGKYNGVNLDIGHFTSCNYDAVAFIREHHARITNLHLKDRKKNHGPNVPWGQGDTPIKAVLELLRKERYHFPANIELEYPVPAGSDRVTEVKKCLAYCKGILEPASV